MKPVVFILSLTFVHGLSSAPIHAAQYWPQISDGITAPQHGGGCRKSSPPGQCCHAGSQPLHCH